MKNLKKLGLLIAVAIMVLFACSKDDEEKKTPATQDKPVLKENVKIIDATKLELDLSPTLIKNGTYQFTSTGTAPSITSGDVVVGEQGEGFIRKVTSATVSGNTITLQTTQGSMADVFKEGSFNFNLDMTNLQNKTSETGFSHTITNQSIYQEGPLSIILNNGQVDFNPNWFFDFDFDKTGINTFEISTKNATLNGNFTATVTASQAVTLIDKSSSILKGAKPYKKTYTKYVPAVLLGLPVVIPIKVVMELDLVLDYSASINATITRQSNFTSNNTFNLGVNYSNGQWNDINSFAPANNFTLSQRTGNAAATINLALTPKVSFKLYGQAGPYASVSLMEQLSGAVASPALDWDFKADVWLKSTIGAQAAILDYSLANYSKTFETDKLSYLTPHKIEKVSGDNQTGTFGNQLATPLKVRLLDDLDKPQANVPVYFTISSGGGKVQTTSILTDAKGFAETLWTLGVSGTQTLNVSAKKADGTALLNSPISFTATSSYNPYKIEKVSGDNQVGTFGNQLTTPLKVKILDNLDKPQANVPVYFTVSSGGGKVQDASILTDANGFAETLWTLGASGTQTVNVSAKKADGTALLNSPISFTATSSYNPHKIEKVSGDNQTGTFGKQLTAPLKVKVLDNLNKPQVNVPVNFTVSSGGGNVQTTSILTDANGFAETLWTLGASGTQTVNVSAKKADGTALLNSPLSFTATSSYNPHKIEKVSGDKQAGIFEKQLTSPLKVKILDNLDKPEANVIVNFTVSSGGGKVQTTSVMTDANGFAQTLWTLGAFGAQTVSVSAKKADGTALINSPLSFTATATAAPCDDTTTPYPLVTIGGQVWMQKNLNVCKYRNGDDIPQVQDRTAWQNLKIGAWCYYENTTANGTVYGKLYNWYAVKDPRGLAPAGYHIPTDAEWTTLTSFLGGESVAGGKMKATTGWTSLFGNKNTNSSGFTGLPGGFRGSGLFGNLGSSAWWWTASEYDTTSAWASYLTNFNGSAGRGTSTKDFGYSVRCLRD